MKGRLAQRRAPKKPKNKSLLKYILIFFVLLLTLITCYLILTRTWDGKSKISLGVANSDGSATVEIIDPASSNFTVINIPKDTLVNASHQLGDWRLGSIWKLGIDEKLGGDFFRTTLVKSFKFPIRKSNLSLLDKFQVSWFKSFLKNADKKEINLVDTGYIKSAKLPDGSQGWRIKEDMPLSLSSLFVNHNFDNLKLEIIDASHMNSSRDVNDVLDTLGIKVAVITKTDTSENNCEVIGENKSAGSELANIFNCDYKNRSTGDNFDIKIILTKKFSQSF